MKCHLTHAKLKADCQSSFFLFKESSINLSISQGLSRHTNAFVMYYGEAYPVGGGGGILTI